MGQRNVEITVRGSLSDHNSDQDARDAAIWNRFVADVRELASRGLYRDIIDAHLIEADEA